MKRIYFIMLFSLFCIHLFSEESQSTLSDSINVKKEKSWGIGAHPIIGYDDEVKLTLGMGGVLYFEPKNKNQDLDEIDIQTTYNWAKQSDFMVDYFKYFNDNKISIEGGFGYKNTPDDYNDFEYDAEFLPFDINVLFKIHEKLFIGPRYNFVYSKVHFKNNDSEVLPENINGKGFSHNSGLGGQILYKNIPLGQIYRRKGVIATLSGIYYAPALLSSKEFASLKFDYRQYFPVFDQSVFAFQFSAKTTKGDVAFFDLLSLESKNLLRGAYDKTGKYFLAGQAEYRFPLFWRIGGTTFLGVGEVEDRINKFGSDICVAGGPGIRIVLNKKKNITLRFDFAFNNSGEVSKYIKIKEAF